MTVGALYYSPSYYITTPATAIHGANTSLAVHWFGDMYSEITVTAEIMDDSNTIVSASKIFRNGECNIYLYFKSDSIGEKNI